MNKIRFFDCPHDPASTVVAFAYAVNSTYFVSARKHALVDGIRKAAPPGQVDAKDAKFIGKCRAIVAESVRAAGKMVEL